jgi:hypothetical protein
MNIRLNKSASTIDDDHGSGTEAFAHQIETGFRKIFRLIPKRCKAWLSRGRSDDEQCRSNREYSTRRPGIGTINDFEAEVIVGKFV